MSTILLLTAETSTEVLPALGLLQHEVRTAPRDGATLLDEPDPDLVLVDARRELIRAREFCRFVRTTGTGCPLFAVLTEGGLAALSAEWEVDDVLLDTAGPAEIEARLRLATARAEGVGLSRNGEVRAGELVIDEETYLARLRGTPLDLTFKEFELLRYLAQHPGRVFTRNQLLQEVWGYDYFGGTRTVDVHIRRLRAKLGAEHEALIGTVRGVGYRFVLADREVKSRPRTRPEFPRTRSETGSAVWRA